MYGSDNHSPTLFDSGAGAWNLSALDTILRRRIRKVMPGESRPASGAGGEVDEEGMRLHSAAGAALVSRRRVQA